MNIRRKWRRFKIRYYAVCDKIMLGLDNAENAFYSFCDNLLLHMSNDIDGRLDRLQTLRHEKWEQSIKTQK